MRDSKARFGSWVSPTLIRYLWEMSESRNRNKWIAAVANKNFTNPSSSFSSLLAKHPVFSNVTDAPQSFELQHDANAPIEFTSHSPEMVLLSAARSSDETSTAKSKMKEERREKKGVIKNERREFEIEEKKRMARNDST